MRKLGLLALAAVAFLGITSSANAATAMLQTNNFSSWTSYWCCFCSLHVYERSLGDRSKYTNSIQIYWLVNYCSTSNGRILSNLGSCKKGANFYILEAINWFISNVNRWILRWSWLYSTICRFRNWNGWMDLHLVWNILRWSWNYGGKSW